MNMRKRLFTVFLIIAMLVTVLAPTTVFAATNPMTPDFPDLPPAYTTGWVKTHSGNGNAVIDTLLESVVIGILAGSFSSWNGIIAAAYDIVQHMPGPGEIFYTTDTYQAFTMLGEYKKFQFTRFYADRARTEFVTSIQSKVTEGIRYSNIDEPDIVA